jgi:hypothetical protein
MKKHVIMAAIYGSFTLFTACSGHSKEGSSDSGATTQDSAGVNTGAGAGAAVDSGTATGAPSQAGAAAGDTSANKRDTAASATSPKK